MASWIKRLRLAVEARGRLVQDQDRRIGQEGARDRHPLALAARQLDAALADQRARSRCGSRSMKSSALASRAACLDLLGVASGRP